jgi:hypothetical protein
MEGRYDPGYDLPRHDDLEGRYDPWAVFVDNERYNEYLVEVRNEPHIDTHREKLAYVVIVSYEPEVIPFESTDANMLAEFFTDWNNIRTGVRSYVIGNDGKWQGLVQRDNYMKEVCDVSHVAELQLHDFKAPSPAMFLLCHGGKDNESLFPACITFCEEMRTGAGHVWARRPVDTTKNSTLSEEYWDRQVYLCDLVRNCGIVFLLCCHGEDIVNDYVSEMNENNRVAEMPEILFYKDKAVVKTTHPILLALLTMLLDSDEHLAFDASAVNLFKAIRRNVFTILKIVKCCDDDVDDRCCADKFWNFLLDMGCVSTYTSEKEEQGLPVTTRILKLKGHKDHYHVYGHGNHYYINEEYKRILWNNFRSLCLVSNRKAGKDPVRYVTYETVKPLPSAGAGAAAAPAATRVRSKVWHALHNYLSRPAGQ